MTKVLLIEDDLCVQFTLAKLLKLSGHEIYVASDGEDAIVQLRRGISFSLILCDIDMPVMDGFRCLDHISQSSKEYALLPFIFMSAYVDQRIVERVKKTSAICVLRKPVSIDILKAIFIALRID